MTKSFLLLLTFALILTSCSNPGKRTEKAVEARSTDSRQNLGTLTRLLKKYETPTQTFTVDSGKSARVIGKQGTVIQINPADYETTAGQPLGKSIRIDLKELTNQQQLLSNNASTLSNGRLLVSGGAYYINLTSDGQQLKLKEGRSLKVEFPKLTDKEMFLFYSERDSLDQLNWQQAAQKFESRVSRTVVAAVGDSAASDTLLRVGGLESVLAYLEDTPNHPLTAKEKRQLEENYALADKLYKAVELKNFGWINCDRFDEIEEKTALRFAFSDKDSLQNAVIYLVFKDINSLMDIPCYLFQGKWSLDRFPEVPVGARTKLIAVSTKNGKFYSYQSNLTISPGQSVTISLKETSEKELDKLFDRD